MRYYEPQNPHIVVACPRSSQYRELLGVPKITLREQLSLTYLSLLVILMRTSYLSS